jgi:hypothetical protein
MEQFSTRLRKLGFDEKTIGYGPSLEEFQELLDRQGLTTGLHPRKGGVRGMLTEGKEENEEE